MWESTTLFIKTFEAGDSRRLASTNCHFASDAVEDSAENKAADFIFTNLASKCAHAIDKDDEEPATGLNVDLYNGAKARVEVHMRHSVRQSISSQGLKNDDKAMQHKLGCAVSKLKQAEAKQFKQQLAVFKQVIGATRSSDAPTALKHVDVLADEACQRFDQRLSSLCAL